MKPFGSTWSTWTGSTSRDSRDTLFVLTVIGWTIAPHVLRLTPWVGLLCAAVLLWRGSLAVRQAPLPSRWWLVGTLFLAAGLTYWTERTLIGKDAGVTLLVVLMALKTLELRARRDALVVFFLGFFLVLTQFLYSQSLWTALTMGLSVWGWLTALTLAHMPAGRPRLREAAGLAGRAALVGTPVMIALFLLFPRIGPLWAMPGAGAHTGLSDNLQLGDVAELANDDSIAFRLRFDGQPPPADALYFRGPVLSDYDGKQWHVDAFTPPALEAPASVEPTYRYEMTLEPLRIQWLPLLEGTRTPPEANPPLAGMPAQPDNSGQWRLRRPLTERVILKAEADLRGPLATGLRTMERRSLLALPPNRHPRTRAWALALRNQPALRDADATTLVNAVLQHISREPYVYTLAPGTYQNDPVDEFWLDRREGFCEHYAASFVVIMRALGVPARIVTGYQGTDFLPVDGYYAVRQSNAHAWTEYWQAGRGWVRADPTGAVAPERIRRGQALEAPPGFIAGAFEAVSPDLRLSLRRFAEALDNRWNQWILGYGKRQQFDLMGQLGMQSPDVLSLIRVLVVLVVGAGLAGAVWAWFDARKQSPWQKLRGGITRELARLGVEAKPSDTLTALAQRLRQQRGNGAEAAAQALLELDLHRYGRPGREGTPPGWWRQFREAVAAARNAPPPPATTSAPPIIGA
ncbi:transglutaminaseTgpA domain-containing protein [Ideonella sp.]|uniref:transglutaminase family protein n=1 Tax=Ideonella sp. TaxID=1929293 RepID=UPI0035B1A515